MQAIIIIIVTLVLIIQASLVKNKTVSQSDLTSVSKKQTEYISATERFSRQNDNKRKVVLKIFAADSEVNITNNFLIIYSLADYPGFSYLS